MSQVLSQLYFLLVSISVVFTGMNCILFFFCVYVLWGQRARSRRLLLLSSVVQFCLCLAQTILFVAYLSIAYTYHASDAESYFLQLSGFALPCYIIYILSNAIGGFLLIWRIYILYNKNIKICIPSIILLALQVGFAGATARGAATEHVDTDRLHAFSLVTWSLIVAVNVCATVLISLRLWTARRNAKAVLSLSKYKSTLVLVVECGALVTVCTLAMLILHAVRRPVGIAGLGITTQSATMAPLLIIARYGVLSRRDDRRSVSPQIPLRISVVRTEDTRVDTPVEFPRKNHRCMMADPLPVFPGGDHAKPFCDA